MLRIRQKQTSWSVPAKTGRGREKTQEGLPKQILWLPRSLSNWLVAREIYVVRVYPTEGGKHSKEGWRAESTPPGGLIPPYHKNQKSEKQKSSMSEEKNCLTNKESWKKYSLVRVRKHYKGSYATITIQNRRSNLVKVHVTLFKTVEVNRPK